MKNVSKKSVEIKAAPAPGLVWQVRQAMLKRNRLATACGFILGGFVPVATFQIAHSEVMANRWLWILVLGGLVYSAKSVFDFGVCAFRQPLKAVAFTLLIEGVMTFSGTPWLSLAALTLLVAINAVSAGVNLALEPRRSA